MGVVVPFPRSAAGDRPELARLVPSGRSLATAFALLLGALIAIVAARETSMFAVRTVEVDGAPRWVDRQVERTLANRHGKSLFGLDLAAARRELEALPTVADVTFDRAYPHTLRVTVVPERPVAVIRQGRSSFVVSERGRVVARVDRRAKPDLARIWVAKDARLEPGLVVADEMLTAVRAVTPLAGARFPSRVRSVRAVGESLALRLASGIEVRLGDATDVDLKLAVAARVLPLLRQGSSYLDVSVPERPVGGIAEPTPLVEIESSVSTTP